jgi:phosphatidate cytidylyltransferase
MGKRVVTALVLMAIAMPALLFGGILFFLLISSFIILASWEYTRLFRAVKMEPNTLVTVGGTLLLLVVRGFFHEWTEATLTVLVLAALAVHLVAYERGRDQAALDFAITVGGFLYLGWIGAYLYDLRSLPDGGWWLILVLGPVWMADSGAYTLGAAYGKHKLAPRLSPKKSWEGYFAGVFTGILFGGFLAYVFSWLGPLHVTIWHGALLGLVLSLVTPLGDLGESLFKRQGGIKDSGSLFPGHGGAFDRIDSWIWAAAIGIYWVRWFLI